MYGAMMSDKTNVYVNTIKCHESETFATNSNYVWQQQFFLTYASNVKKKVWGMEGSKKEKREGNQED